MSIRRLINRIWRRIRPNRVAELPLGREVLRFAQPTESCLTQIGVTLRGLEVVPLDERDYLHTQETIRLVGAMHSVLSELGRVLEDDFAEFQRDGVAWNGGFDYVVRIEDSTPHRLQVMTRLYPNDRPGGVYYGRIVQRVGRDSFALWIDD